MKRILRPLSLFLAVILTFALLSGCAGSYIELSVPEHNVPRDAVVYMDLAAEMVPLSASPAIFSIPVPSAPGTNVRTNQRATIDFSNMRDGYVMVRAEQRTSVRLMVTITGPSAVRYQYRLNGTGAWEVFPLSDGNGKYVIGVHEQIEPGGTRFSTLLSAEINVTLKDEFAPFLRPNQFVNFSAQSKATAKAAELTESITGMYPRVEAIFNFIINNISYDRNFAREVQQGMHAGYVPDVDAVLASGKGICFDFAALMTAMLRSLGIPTRLVVGFVGDVKHAWIDVYSDTDGWINNIIHFDGNTWNLMDPTFSATGNKADVIRFIGTGQNHQARFLY